MRLSIYIFLTYDQKNHIFLIILNKSLYSVNIFVFVISGIKNYYSFFLLKNQIIRIIIHFQNFRILVTENEVDFFADFLFKINIKDFFIIFSQHAKIIDFDI